MDPRDEPDSAEHDGEDRLAGQGGAKAGTTIGATRADPVAGHDVSEPGGADCAEVGRRELGRLRWRCRRGVRELDELLVRYVDEHYATASLPHQAAFRELLDSHDPLIYAYFLGRRTPHDPVLLSLIDRITAGARND